MGNVIGKLKRLDISEESYFIEGDYELLSQITKIQNHWAHKGCVMFAIRKEESERHFLSKLADSKMTKIDWKDFKFYNVFEAMMEAEYSRLLFLALIVLTNENLGITTTYDFLLRR